MVGYIDIHFMSENGEKFEGVKTELTFSIVSPEREQMQGLGEVSFNIPRGKAHAHASLETAPSEKGRMWGLDEGFLDRPQGNAYAYAQLNTVPLNALNEILKNKPEKSKLLAENSFFTIMLDLTVNMEDPTNTYLNWVRFNIEMDKKSKILLLAPKSIDIEAKVTRTGKNVINISPSGKVTIQSVEASVTLPSYTKESGYTFEAPVNIKKYLCTQIGERTALCELYGHTELLEPLHSTGETSIAKVCITLQTPRGNKPKIKDLKVKGEVTKKEAILWIDLKGSIELKEAPDSLKPT